VFNELTQKGKRLKKTLVLHTTLPVGANMQKVAGVTSIFHILLFVSYAQSNVELDQRLFKKTILERLAKQDAKIKLQDDKIAKQDDVIKMLEAEIKTYKAVQTHINETIDRHGTQIEKINGSFLNTTAMESNEGKWMLLSTRIHFTVSSAPVALKT
jgi:septal ring factor EnvC (AmiA/AmiB activator)